ncbi:MAG TPA: hypothetical protein VFS20_31150, partial [Longimicrobium sp.]|nr:hypothetical protein [Longimicrobium sp.]
MTLSDIDPPAALDRLAAASPAAASLLLLCACLDPAHPIPVQALDAGADVLPEPLADALRDTEGRERVWDALLDAGAGGVAGDDLVMNDALVRAAAERMDDDARCTWAGATALMLEKAFPADPA